MSDVAALRPGALLGAYPEREPEERDPLDRLKGMLPAVSAKRGITGAGRLQRFLARVAERESAIENFSTETMGKLLRDLRHGLSTQGLTEELVARAFAVVRILSWRTLGMRHNEAQLVGGSIILNGMLAEMQTGEGKTLTATLAAATAGLAGIPVHVVTANDYLAARDAKAMNPLYDALGLRVSAIGEGMGDGPRRAAYRCAVTYCTGKQVAFDYLRDRVMAGGRAGRLGGRLERLSQPTDSGPKLLMRGLCFAIVDEADSVLIDEARTPLILSRAGSTQRNLSISTQALGLVAALDAHAHFRLRDGQIELTPSGQQRLAEQGAELGGAWTGRRWRETLACQALAAEHLYRRDHDYLVKDGKVSIIDENTGRLMPDRSWERGLQQMIETKEGCELTPSRETVARSTYQRFFRRYLRLGAMTGTAREVSRELWSVYRLPVVSVPTYRRSRRTALAERHYTSRAAKWRAIAASARAARDAGRPVLVGTRTVADSEALSLALDEAGLVHEVLNARQDRHESEIVAAAGEPGRITVATNMAGRGTDIRLGPEVVVRGGLHVIVAERNASRRIDRQLIGRCARQGDPGSHQAFSSLEDELLMARLPRWLVALAGSASTGEGRVTSVVATPLVRGAQRAVERKHARDRKALLRQEEQLADLLAFAGQPD